MRYAGIIYDDTAAAPGLSLSLYTQGCHFHCKGCHNPETWSFDDGYEYTAETRERILDALIANDILRTLSILGGEPLCPENINEVIELCRAARERYGEKLQIYVWTGYTIDELTYSNYNYSELFHLANFLITGRYEEDKRDITLRLRGSSNQKIIRLIHNDEDVLKIQSDELGFMAL